MKVWQKELQTHCEMDPALEFVGYSDGSRTYAIIIMRFNNFEKHLLKIWTVSSNYEVEIYNKSENNLLRHLDSKEFRNLKSLHGWLERETADFNLVALL